MSKYAHRMKAMERSANIIKGLFSSMNDPDVISFGGGAIAKECLPIDKIREITVDVMKADSRGYEILSYGQVLGAKDLREVIVRDLLAPKGVEANVDNIIVLTGGLEAMNLMCQLYIEPGDVILVESPTFVHSVETFSMFEANCIPVDMDDDGMITEDLEEKIIKYNPKMVYVIPTFQNPTGITLSLKRRERMENLEEICKIPEIDVIFLGPYDMSQSMGVTGQVTHELVENAAVRVLEITKKYNKAAGIFAGNGEAAKKRAQQGFKYITIGVDTTMFGAKCVEEINKFFN